MADGKYNMSRIDAMDGHEFEHFIATLLRKLDYEKVEVTPGSGDQGVDVLAEKEGVRYAIQCKCYSSDLGNTPVQEVNTGKMVYRCHVGIVVTNRYFTQSAREAAKATSVLLWDRSKLEKLIAQAEFEVDSPKQQTEDPPTLWSGSPLLKRGGIALKDKEWKKAGQFFDRVLNADPENAEAYLGLVMAEAELSDTDEFMQIYINGSFRLNQLNQNNLLHAKEFAGTELRIWFEKLEIQQKNTKIQREKQAKECTERLEKEQEERKKRIYPLAAIRKKLEQVSKIITVTPYDLMGVQLDGTVVSVNEKAIRTWSDIVAISAQYYFSNRKQIVGLRLDGTVVAAGPNTFGECMVSDWKDIADITTAIDHTAGVKTDGTVVVAGRHHLDYTKNVNGWTDIKSVVFGDRYILGLRSEGSVIIGSISEYGGCPAYEILSCENAVAITQGNGEGNIALLKSDGTVEIDSWGIQSKVNYSEVIKSWMDIVAISVGYDHIVGLKSDGSVVANGENNHGQCNVSGWNNIVAISAGGNTTVGLKSDGTVVIAGEHSDEWDVSNWKLFNNLDTLQQDRKKAMTRRQEEERAEAERCRIEELAKKRAALEAEQATLQAELANLKGLFTGRRRREIETRLAEIEANMTKKYIK